MIVFFLGCPPSPPPLLDFIFRGLPPPLTPPCCVMTKWESLVCVCVVRWCRHQDHLPNTHTPTHTCGSPPLLGFGEGTLNPFSCFLLSPTFSVVAGGTTPSPSTCLSVSLGLLHTWWKGSLLYIVHTKKTQLDAQSNDGVLLQAVSLPPQRETKTLPAWHTDEARKRTHHHILNMAGISLTLLLFFFSGGMMKHRRQQPLACASPPPPPFVARTEQPDTAERGRRTCHQQKVGNARRSNNTSWGK